MSRQPPRQNSLQQVLSRHGQPPRWRLPPMPGSPLPATQAHPHYPGTSTIETKTRGSEKARMKPEAHKQTFLSCFKLTRIRRRMFRPTKASVSCNNLSASMTYEHANSMLSSTRLQLLGGGAKPGEPDRTSLDTPGPTMPEDPGAGVMTPRAVLLGTPMPKPYITKSQSEPLVSSPGWG
jgi:hypothetical protein